MLVAGRDGDDAEGWPAARTGQRHGEIGSALDKAPGDGEPRLRAGTRNTERRHGARILLRQGQTITFFGSR